MADKNGEQDWGAVLSIRREDIRPPEWIRQLGEVFSALDRERLAAFRRDWLRESDPLVKVLADISEHWSPVSFIVDGVEITPISAPPPPEVARVQQRVERELEDLKQRLLLAHGLREVPE